MPHTALPLELDLEPDPVIEAYKKDVDRSLIRENLRRTVDERLQNLQALCDWIGTAQLNRARRTKERKVRAVQG